MRPRPEELRVVDEAVRRLDRAEAIEAGDRPPKKPLTLGYGEIIEAWDRYLCAVNVLDAAVRQPLAEGSVAAFGIAWEVMHGTDAWKLAGWLAHVGEALQRRAIL